EAVDAGLEARRQLRDRLADAAEDDALGCDAGGARAEQLAAAHDVGAGAQLREQPQQREVAVRLDGIGDEPVERLERAVERAVPLLDRRAAVDVQWRAEVVYEPFGGDALAVELCASVREVLAQATDLSTRAPRRPPPRQCRRTPRSAWASPACGTPRRGARGSSPS